MSGDFQQLELHLGDPESGIRIFSSALRNVSRVRS